MKFTSKKSLEAVVVCAIAAIACYLLGEANVPPLSIFSWTAMEYFFLGMETYGAYHFIQKVKEEKAETKARKLTEAHKAEAEAKARKLTEARKAKAETEARKAAIEASKKEAYEAAIKVASSKAEEIISEARKEVELSSTELDKDFDELKLCYFSTSGAVVVLSYLQNLEGKKLEYNQETDNFRISAWDSKAKRTMEITLSKNFDICMGGIVADLMWLPVDERFIGEYIEKAIKKLSHDAALAIMTIEEKILPSTDSEPATDSSYTETTDITVIILKPEEL